jgi:diadenosine tetraphosphatase ApaH/serine/threonine PP2A family protein phosphatase
MSSATPPPAHFLQSVRTLIHELIKTRIPSGTPPRPAISFCDVTQLIDSVSELHRTEPATLILSGNHYIVGDIHGNVDSLIRIFGHFGYPPHSKYLFLGDYIDRGRNSCEVVLLLYGLKLLFPNHLHLLRGNHEFFAMTDAYGFRRECEGRMSRSMYDRIVCSFDHLPIAARIGGNFCVHGGISPRLTTPEAIKSITKLQQTEDFLESPSCDLLWSDPREKILDFEKSPRGCGVLFGRDAAQRFLEACPGAFRIIRSHESCAAGFDWPFNEGGPVLTVFSSCDYCETGNNAGIAAVSDYDTSAKCVALPPLMPSQLGKRRVIFPDWAIDNVEMEFPDMVAGNNGQSDVEIEI